MAVPVSLSVSVDLEEYSRCESDRDTIVVTLNPVGPTTTITASTIITDTTLLVADATPFTGLTLPFTARVGSGVTGENVTVTGVAGLTLTVNPMTIAHTAGDAIAVIGQVNVAGEEVSVSLVKARRNRDVSVATVTVTLTNALSQTMSFHLPSIVDQDEVPKVRRGSYFVQAISVSNPLVTVVSADFLVSLMTVAQFKSNYLHGADRHASSGVVAVKDQPAAITGVRVVAVSFSHKQGWFPLSYNYSESTVIGQEPVRLLSWCCGPAVSIVPSKTRYTLRCGDGSTDYIEVAVSAVGAMPVQVAEEELLIERTPIGDAEFRRMLEAAISWLEDSELAVFLEPTRVVTEIDPNAITYPSGSDVPDFVLADWDKQVSALTYTRPAPGHWINFRMPFYPLQTFNSLYGKTSNVRIIDIALEWVEHHVDGFVELVPFNQEVAFNFIGLIWIESLRNPIPIPNFWNFDAIVGFKKTPAVLLEFVAKKAAIEALTRIGQAFRTGISSQSVSRDGISESLSFLNSSQFGIFSATINSYNKWIEEQTIKLRGAFRGVNMAVV